MKQRNSLTPEQCQANPVLTVRLAAAVRSATPSVLFGLRLWVAVCLALYIAFWLELDNAYWAGTSAAVVCQASLGASLRKGWFRIVGTVTGAMAIVVLTACLPQDRFGFLLCLALWCAACGLVATLVHNFAAYAAALAGYTAVIIASDTLGAFGAANTDVFILAVDRAGEICIGIVCAIVVLAGTDFGDARRRLAIQLAAVSAEIAGGFSATFLLAGTEQWQKRSLRRELIRRVIALDPLIDQALGEASDLRSHSPLLQTAVDGLFAALSGWRTAADHLELPSTDEGRREAALVLKTIRQELQQCDALDWTIDPSRLRLKCSKAVRTLMALPASTPSLRLLADQTAEALIGLGQALDGLILLTGHARAISGRRAISFHVPDWLPSLVNAARAFFTIVAVELFWIVTGWPNGAMAITFAAIAIILFSTKADQAYPTTMSFMVGTGLAAASAAFFKFAVLPGVVTFAGFCLAIGIYLVPASALMTQPWQTVTFTAMAANFIPLLTPANPMTYDPRQFYNSALAIIAGAGAAALSFRLLPPLSPELRAWRLLALTLRDLRRLTKGPIELTSKAWERRIHGRLSVLPEQTEPLQHAQLLAALAVGVDIISLRRFAYRHGQDVGLNAALSALARGDSSAATEHLTQFDRRLATLSCSASGRQTILRTQGDILAMSEALVRHATYFDSGAR